MKRATLLLLILSAAMSLFATLRVANAPYTWSQAGYTLALLLPGAILGAACALCRGPRGTDIALLAAAVVILLGSAAITYLLIAGQHDDQAFAWAALFGLVIAAAEMLAATLGTLAAWIITHRHRSRP